MVLPKHIQRIFGSIGDATLDLTGDLKSATITEDVAGKILVDGAITKISSRAGTLSGTLRASTEIGTVSFDDIDGALVSTYGNIKSIQSKTDILDSCLLSGYDIGPDGLPESSDELLNEDGQVTITTLKMGQTSIFGNSYAVAGIRPYAYDAQADIANWTIMVPVGLDVVHDTSASGIIENANLGQVYDGDPAVGE